MACSSIVLSGACLSSVASCSLPRQQVACSTAQLSSSPSYRSELLGHARLGLPQTRSLYGRVAKVRHANVICMADQGETPSASPQVWVGRVAMIAWSAAVATEIITGKGLLATIGVTSPAPELALAVTGVVGFATAFSVFMSAPKN